MTGGSRSMQRVFMAGPQRRVDFCFNFDLQDL